MNFNLKEKLNKTPGIHAWQYRILKEESYQLYLAKEKYECRRKNETEQIEVTIYRELKDGKLGNATFYFTPVEEFKIDEKIDKAFYIAGLASQKSFKLADFYEYEQIQSYDERLFEEPYKFLEDFRKRIVTAVKKEPEVELSSSECYLMKKSTELKNSRGCEGKFLQSKISWDFVILSGKELESESWYETSCCNYDQLNIEEKIAEYAEYARDNTKTILPKTMKTSVIIDAKTILPIFSPLLSHSSGQFFHDNISCFRKGEEILRGNKIKGETLNLSSNPTIPYGLKSVPFDRDGIALSHNEIIKNSKLENIWASKRYASYLGIEPTGDFSNMEISTGNSSLKELLTAGDKSVYYIVKFSLLLPDNVSGDFATEIRFGYEITPEGQKIPIKGGSVTGNIFEMFSNARFSKEKVMEGSYIGPKAIRFEGISISGS